VGNCSPIQWGHAVDNNGDPEDGNAQRCTFTITDAAGNTLKLVEDVMGRQIVIVSFQYNNAPVITPPNNNSKFTWSLDKNGALKEFEQDVTLGSGRDKQE